MNPVGLSDSFAGVAVSVQACPVCGAALKVNEKDCLKCLLRQGLAADEAEEGDDDTLQSLLGQVELRDADWQLGNYQILEEIGRGGMGVIYRARQRYSRRIVALKRVQGYHADAREALERFRREAEAAASLDHPNILPIYEVGEADGLPFFTMKLATGGSLQQAAPALASDPRECVRLLAKVARAVAWAHRQGILHRDLKPGNILLDSRGEPLVSDFGLAKWLDTVSDLTRSLAVFGTPGFIAPEQAHGPSAALTPAADIYSLGAILFDLLTGRPPFLGEHALAVIKQASEQTAPRLRTINESLDRDLETICAKCLEREPQARYRSASDLAEDLERWLEGRPIIARPVSPPAKLWRWARRNPALAGAAALCVVAGSFALARQLDGWRLQSEINTRIAAQHSVEVLPLLDLDAAAPSAQAAAEIGRGLAEQIQASGPAQVTITSEAIPLVQSATNAAPPKHYTRSLLSGTIRSKEGKQRISLHLLDANSREPVLHELIEVESPAVLGGALAEAARRIYRALSREDLASAAKRPTDPGLLDPEAQRFIAQGVELANRRGGVDLERSIACFRHALALQPNSAAAHAGIARGLGFQAGYRSSAEPLALALQHARKAVELNPTHADGYLVVAAILGFDGKIAQSIEQAYVAIEHSPVTRRAAYLLANHYKALGRPDKTLAWMEVAVRNGEAATARDSAKADCFVMVGDDERAESLYDHDRKLHPDQPEGWMGICRLRLLNGRVEEARAIYQSEIKGHTDFAFASQIAAQVEFFGRNFGEAEQLYSRLHDRDPMGGGMFYGRVTYGSALGRMWIERDPVNARQLLEAARKAELDAISTGSDDPAVRYRLAAVESTLGETDSALEHLRTAAEAGWIDFRSLSLDPRFDTIRDDPRFNAIVRGMVDRAAQLREHLNRNQH